MKDGNVGGGQAGELPGGWDIRAGAWHPIAKRSPHAVRLSDPRLNSEKSAAVIPILWMRKQGTEKLSNFSKTTHLLSWELEQNPSPMGLPHHQWYHVLWPFSGLLLL